MKFNGRDVPYQVFFKQFYSQVSPDLGYDDSDRLRALIGCLVGPALIYLATLDHTVAGDFHKLNEALATRFNGIGGGGGTGLWNQFLDCAQRPEESIQEWGDRCILAYNQACPNSQPHEKNQQLTERYIRGLRSKELIHFIRTSRPTTVEQARESAEYGVFSLGIPDGSLPSPRATAVVRATSTEIPPDTSGARGSSDPMAAMQDLVRQMRDSMVRMQDNLREEMSQLRSGNSIQNRPATPAREVRFSSQGRQGPPNRQGSSPYRQRSNSPGGERRCFICEETGHLARNCRYNPKQSPSSYQRARSPENYEGTGGEA